MTYEKYVIIKGLNKPKNCQSCHFNESNLTCFITKGEIDRDDYTCDIECPINEILGTEATYKPVKEILL